MILRTLLTLSTLILAHTAAAAPTQEQLDAALIEVKAEEKVFDASWQDTSIPSLNARLFDDGSRRNGYAGYLCMLIAEHGINGGAVRIIDVVRPDNVLGQSVCK